MMFGAAYLLCLIGASFSSAALAQGLQGLNLVDRLDMYSNWASQVQGRSGRGLMHLADGPSAAVVVQPTTTPKPTGVGQSFPPTGYGTCKVLRYHTGFANLTLNYNKVIPNSPNFGECCHSCDADPLCKAWTRVAGGTGAYAANFRNCYLDYDVKNIDKLLTDARANNHVGPQTIAGRVDDASIYPELRYVNEGFATADKPVILESGTKDDVYPAVYYGCPYYPTATTPCAAPKNCNVDGNGNFVAPPCIG